MSDVLEFPGHSVNGSGWKNLTYQQMFESALGYKILPTEPQQFCDSCARILIEWHEFKELCQKTQDELVSVKMEESVSETVWVVDDEAIDVKCEPEFSIEYLPEMDDLPQNFDSDQDSDFITVHFKMFVRNFGLQPIKSLTTGIVTVEGTTLEEIKHQVWLHVKPFLKREIVFDDMQNAPVWKNEFPLKKDLTKFILFQDTEAKQTFTFPNLRKLKSWNNEEKNLLIYPYSKSLQTLLEWKIAVAALINEDPADLVTLMRKYKTLQKCKGIKEKKEKPEKFKNIVQTPVDISFPPDRSNFNVVITFQANLRYFLGQTRANNFLGNYTVKGNDLTEFKHHLWQSIQPHIVKEIIFHNSGEPTFSQDSPKEYELKKFVTFSDKQFKKKYTLGKYLL